MINNPLFYKLLPDVRLILAKFLNTRGRCSPSPLSPMPLKVDVKFYCDFLTFLSSSTISLEGIYCAINLRWKFFDILISFKMAAFISFQAVEAIQVLGYCHIVDLLKVWFS